MSILGRIIYIIYRTIYIRDDTSMTSAIFDPPSPKKCWRYIINVSIFWHIFDFPIPTTCWCHTCIIPNQYRMKKWQRYHGIYAIKLEANLVALQHVRQRKKIKCVTGGHRKPQQWQKVKADILRFQKWCDTWTLFDWYKR